MPKAVNVEERQDAFIEASWELIAKEGLAAATMRRVAAQAGCTTGSLTHYFPDRKALLVQALRAAHYAAGARMAAVIGETEGEYERLCAVVRESLPLDETRLREWRVWLAFWGASRADGDLAGEDRQRYGEWRGLLRALLNPLCDTPAEEADLLIAMIDGLGVKLARDTVEGPALARAQTRCARLAAAYLDTLRPA